jgi:putative ABC transport system permease protein
MNVIPPRIPPKHKSGRLYQQIALGPQFQIVLTRALIALGAGIPATFVVIALLLAAVALLAGYIPGRRAARIDPMISLRAE